MSSVFRQIERIPDDATHLVLSAGGNDALWLSGDLFPQPCEDIRAALHQLGGALTEFTAEYRRLITELRELRLPITICTIYDSVPGLEMAETTGVGLFNDTISRVAFEFNLPLIDLRVICNELTDYATISPIEPSVAGGGKIARAILAAAEGSSDYRRVVV